jgi:hypothetical protein
MHNGAAATSNEFADAGAAVKVWLDMRQCWRLCYKHMRLDRHLLAPVQAGEHTVHVMWR